MFNHNGNGTYFIYQNGEEKKGELPVRRYIISDNTDANKLWQKLVLAFSKQYELQLRIGKDSSWQNMLNETENEINNLKLSLFEMGYFVR